MASKRPLRIYADTSVFGGCQDPEFSSDSLRLFDLVSRGRMTLPLSDVLFQELAPAPASVRAVLANLPSARVERVAISDDVIELGDAYIESKIVSRKWLDDATHVAAATVGEPTRLSRGISGTSYALNRSRCIIKQTSRTGSEFLRSCRHKQ